MKKKMNRTPMVRKANKKMMKMKTCKIWSDNYKRNSLERRKRPSRLQWASPLKRRDLNPNSNNHKDKSNLNPSPVARKSNNNSNNSNTNSAIRKRTNLMMKIKKILITRKVKLKLGLSF